MIISADTNSVNFLVSAKLLMLKIDKTANVQNVHLTELHIFISFQFLIS